MLLRPALFRAARFPPSSLSRSLVARRSYSSSGQSAGQTACENWLLTILGLNTAVFAAWKYADNTIPGDLKASISPETYRQLAKYVPLDKRQLLDAIHTHFVFKRDDFREGRWWTPITCAFSHATLPHFVCNTVGLYSFGTSLINHCPKIRPAHFLTLYLGAALAGSIGFDYNNRYFHENRSFNSIGASGSVMSIATACALIAPQARWQFMFIPIGFPAWAMVTAFYAYSAFSLRDPNSRIGHGGHLGGAAFGAAYFFLVLRRLLFRF